MISLFTYSLANLRTLSSVHPVRDGHESRRHNLDVPRARVGSSVFCVGSAGVSSRGPDESVLAILFLLTVDIIG